jgi:hypothetical protein
MQDRNETPAIIAEAILNRTSAIRVALSTNPANPIGKENRSAVHRSNKLVTAEHWQTEPALREGRLVRISVTEYSPPRSQ